LSDIQVWQTGWQVDKRDRFIAELRNEARAMGLSFQVDYRKGKGGHAMVYVGDKLTTLPNREIDPPRRRESSGNNWGWRAKMGNCAKPKGKE
jgi:hypothetical protein